MENSLKALLTGKKALFTPPPPGGASYYGCIDVLRGLAAFAVVLTHYDHFYLMYPNINLLESHWKEPFHTLFFPFFEWGNNAVTVFWVISGFVFCHIYGNLKTVDGWRFFSNRFSRLYPLHFATLMIMVIIKFASLYFLGHEENAALTNDWTHFIPQLFMASHWGIVNPGEGSFNWPTWSVSMEIPIYFGFFWLLKIRRIDLLMAIIACIICNYEETVSGGNLWRCARCFFAGVLIYRVHENISPLANLIPALVVLCFACLGRKLFEHYQIMELYALALAVGFVWTAAALERFHFPRLISLTHRLKWIGDSSYSSYLLHIPVQMSILILIDALNVGRGIVNSHVFFLSYFLIVISLSILSYHFFEMPAEKWLRAKMTGKIVTP